MKVDKQQFYEMLRQLNKVADQKSSMSILECVELRTEDGVLSMRTTDLTLTLIGEMPCEGAIYTLAPCTKLMQVVKPENKKDVGTISITLLGTDYIQIDDCGFITNIRPHLLDLFPMPPHESWGHIGTWDKEGIVTALKYTLPAASKDFSRPSLSSVFFIKHKVVTTDGHRLHIDITSTNLTKDILIPLEAATTLLSIAETGVAAFKAGKRAKFQSGRWTLITQQVEGEFPPYDQVVPSTYESIIKVEAEVIKKAIKKLTRISGKDRFQASFAAGCSIGLESETTKTQVPHIESLVGTPPVVMGFNVTYFLEALHDGETTFKFTGALDPLLIEHPDGKQAVVMPMRI